MDAQRVLLGKTYYMDKDGIRVEGLPNKTAARKAWTEARDAFAKRAAECGTWTFAYGGYVVVVTPRQHDWEYTIVSPTDGGVRHGSCYYGAPNQVKAIVVALGALVQRLWTRETPDDGALFDDVMRLARVHPDEAIQERSSFVYVAQHWRNHPVAA